MPCMVSVITMVLVFILVWFFFLPEKQDLFRDGQKEERMELSASKGVDLLH